MELLAVQHTVSSIYLWSSELFVTLMCNNDLTCYETATFDSPAVGTFVFILQLWL